MDSRETSTHTIIRTSLRRNRVVELNRCWQSYFLIFNFLLELICHPARIVESQSLHIKVTENPETLPAGYDARRE